MESQMKRRQAILSGLAPLLREEQTAAALEIFDSSFAEGASFNLQSFVDRVYAQFKPDCALRDLHRALVQSVFLGVSNDGANPAEGYGESSPANTIFVQVLGGYLQRVARHDHKVEIAVRTYLMEKLATLELPVNTKRALVQWLSHQAPGITLTLSSEGMRHLLNLAYVLVCEYMGPVVADRLLSEVVKEVEQLPEARVVSPRALL